MVVDVVIIAGQHVDGLAHHADFLVDLAAALGKAIQRLIGALQQAAGLAHAVHHGLRVAGGLPGQGVHGFDLAAHRHRQRMGALGQFAHFVGHHGKPSAGFASAGGFDGGVQRQQVSLI